jgi:integrase
MGRRGNDEGSIWHRSDGRWSGSYFVPTPNGGRVRRYVYGSNREEVHGKLVSMMAQVQRGLPIAGTRDTVGSYLDSWLSEVAARRVRANTLTGYRTNVRLHIVPRIGTRKLGKLTARDVRLMLEDCRQSGLSAGSVKYVHATLRAALEDAVREDVLGRNVAKLVRLSTPERPETRVLTAAEGRTLLRANQDDRVFGALVLLLLLGLRRSEVLGLRWCDVDLVRGVLHVRQGLHYLEGRLQLLPPKTRRSRRTIPLPQLCVDALEAHKERQHQERTESLHPWPDTGLVFVSVVGTPIDPNNFSRTFAQWCARAAVPTVRLHDLRHTCVSMLLSLGVPPRVVMEIVGHAALEMTMNVYAHVNLDDQRAALDRLNGLLDEASG